jgi:hypothetical protein
VGLWRGFGAITKNDRDLVQSAAGDNAIVFLRRGSWAVLPFTVPQLQTHAQSLQVAPWLEMRAGPPLISPEASDRHLSSEQRLTRI